MSSPSSAPAGGVPRRGLCGARRASTAGAPPGDVLMAVLWDRRVSVWTELPRVANRRLPGGIATSPQAAVAFLAPWPDVFPVLLHATNAALHPAQPPSSHAEPPATQPFTSIMASRVVRSWDTGQAPPHQAEVLAGLARSPFTEPIPVYDDGYDPDGVPAFAGVDDASLPTTSGSLEMVGDGFWGTESGQWAVVTGEQDLVDDAPDTVATAAVADDESFETPPVQHSSLLVAASIIALALGVSLWTYLWWSNMPADIADPAPSSTTSIPKVFPDTTSTESAPLPEGTPTTESNATVAPPTPTSASPTATAPSSVPATSPTQTATSPTTSASPSTTRPVRGTPTSSFTSTVPMPHGDQSTRGTGDP